MIYPEHIVKELEEIVNKGLEDLPIPYVKGKSIRIKNMIVRKSPKGYLVYDLKENIQIARTRFKTTAIAIAKNYAQGKDIRNTVTDLDILLSKHYNDAMFFKNSILRTTDPVTKEIREIRLSIAIDESERVRRILDRFIFN
jgi:hypothetical protein